MRNETELFVNEDTEILCFVLPQDVLAEHGDVPYRALRTFRDEECKTFIGRLLDVLLIECSSGTIRAGIQK